MASLYITHTRTHVFMQALGDSAYLLLVMGEIELQEQSKM